MNLRDRHRRILLVLVTLVALGVWGRFTQRLFSEGGSGGAPGRAVDTTAAPSAHPMAEAVPAFQGGGRDPFRPPAALRARKEKAPGVGAAPAAPKTRPKPPLTVTLAGVVGDVALLQERGGAAQMARAGETVAASEVVLVESDRVVLQRAGGQRDTLRLLP